MLPVLVKPEPVTVADKEPEFEHPFPEIVNPEPPLKDELFPAKVPPVTDPPVFANAPLKVPDETVPPDCETAPFQVPPATLPPDSVPDPLMVPPDTVPFDVTVTDPLQTQPLDSPA